MWLLVAAFLAMLFKDALNCLYVRWLGRRRVWRAGSADGVGDLAALVSVGITGAAIKQHGFCLWSAAACALIFMASVCGTVIGDLIETRMQ